MLNNKLKTILLLMTLSAILLFFGYVFGGKTGLNFAIFMSLIMNFLAYFYSDKFVLKMYKAQPLNKREFNNVYNIMESICDQMDLPMPKLWLVETPMANAFATGRNPNNASVAITTGLLDLLNQKELKAVLAHEASHIKNRDILVSTIAATLATAISYVANMAQYSLILGNNRDGNQRRNPIAMILLVIFMPIAALLVQLSISRSREYLADETSAHYNEDPMSLASALEKLQDNLKQAHLQNNDVIKASTATLFIVYPFTSSNWVNLFSTHPPIAKRIENLKAIYKKMFKK